MNSPEQNKLICWDKDHTIGEIVRDSFVPYPDIRSVLTELSLMGFQHYMTTSAGEGPTWEQMQSCGLDDIFDEVDIYGNESIETEPKIYHTPYFVFSEETGSKEPHRDMIIIGDSVKDQAGDLIHVVFIGLDKAETQLTTLPPIISHLLAMGDGEIRKGFDRIYLDADLTDTSPENHQVKHISLPNSVAFDLEYMDLYFQVPTDLEFSYPVIRNITAAPPPNVNSL